MWWMMRQEGKGIGVLNTCSPFGDREKLSHLQPYGRGSFNGNLAQAFGIRLEMNSGCSFLWFEKEDFKSLFSHAQDENNCGYIVIMAHGLLWAQHLACKECPIYAFTWIPFISGPQPNSGFGLYSFPTLPWDGVPWFWGRGYGVCHETACLKFWRMGWRGNVCVDSEISIHLAPSCMQPASLGESWEESLRGLSMIPCHLSSGS